MIGSRWQHEDERLLLYEAVAAWGDHAQVLQLFEEMAELQVKLCHRMRHRRFESVSVDSIAEEIADVRICLNQMEMLFQCGRQAQVWRDTKLDRLKEHLNETSENGT